MPKTKTRCKICNVSNKAILEKIDALILGDVAYRTIITVAAGLGVNINVANISNHKRNHLDKRIAKFHDDPEKIELPKFPIPEQKNTESIDFDNDEPLTGEVKLADALATVIKIGLKNIINNPELVSPVTLMQALETARKMNLFTGKDEDFDAAWAEYAEAKPKRTRTVIMSEEVYEDDEKETAPPLLQEPNEDPFMNWVNDNQEVINVPTTQ